MKTRLQIKKCIASAVFLMLSVTLLPAQVLFETNFNAEEGWVKEGAASTTGTLLSRDITFDGKTFHIEFNQVAIDPAKETSGCSVGQANIQKNGQSATSTNVSTDKTRNGYILLPAFDEDIQVSFSYAASTKSDRTIAVEYSLDDGASWLCTKDGLAPIHGNSCADYKCPTKFTAGTRVRLTNHTNGGGLAIFSIKVEKYSDDNISPTVVEYLPANEATEISPATRSFTLLFSEPIKDGGEGNVVIVGANSGSSCQLTSGQLKYTNTVVEIPVPDDFFLSPNETYIVQLENGVVKDLANNNAGEIIWQFTTKVNASADNDIISFKVPKQVGDEVIDSVNGTIKLTVASGVDLANISADNIQVEVSEFATIIVDYKNFAEGPQEYVVTAENGTKKTWTVTITVQDYAPAVLPVSYLGDVERSWKNITEPGWLTNIVNDDNTTKFNNYSFTQANISQYGHYLKCWYNGPANRLSFRIRYGKATSNYQINVEESATGEDGSWTEVVTFKPTIDAPTDVNPDPAPMIPTSDSSLGLRSYPLKSDSRYVRWFYQVRTNTSFYLDDIIIENVATDAVAPILSEEIPSYVNYSDNTKAQVILKFSETVKVSEELIARNTAIKINGVDYFELNILALRGGELVLTSLPPLEDQTEYTIEIPSDALTDLAGNAFAGKIIKFTTDLTNGISVSESDKDDVIYYSNGNIVLGGENITSARLYSMTGLLIGISDDGKNIPVSSLTQGAYIVRYKKSDGVIRSAKIHVN
ncbi:Ig-like domain-containing protein [Coprobacter sp.]